MRKLLASLICLIVTSICLGEMHIVRPYPTLEEVDGSPSIRYGLIKVSNGSLTDNTTFATLVTGSGGAGGYALEPATVTATFPQLKVSTSAGTNGPLIQATTGSTVLFEVTGTSATVSSAAFFPGQTLFPAGSAAAPGIAFLTQPGLGLRANGSTLDIDRGGGAIASFGANPVFLLGGGMQAGSGSAAAPAYSFSIGSTRGMLDTGSDLAFSANSQARLVIVSASGFIGVHHATASPSAYLEVGSSSPVAPLLIVSTPALGAASAPSQRIFEVNKSSIGASVDAFVQSVSGTNLTASAGLSGSSLSVTGAGNGVIRTTATINNLTVNVGGSSMTVTNSSFSFSTPISVSSVNVTGNLVLNSYGLFTTTMVGVNLDTVHVVIATATVAANSTLTVTPPRCPTLVSALSAIIYNSPAVAAGGVEFGAYNFGDATLPIINRDVTDTKNVLYSVLCR